VSTIPDLNPSEAPLLVCGLGAFGQAVLTRLLAFGTPLRLLDLHQPDWRTPELQREFDNSITLGDMRKPHVLRQAGVERARAVLLLSADSGINVEAALQVRLLNDAAEIVVRTGSDLESLGSLLEQRLPRLAVVNPVRLSAGALVQALRPGAQLARFELRGETFEVRQAPLEDHRVQRPVRLDRGETGLVVMPLVLASPQAPGAPQQGGDARQASLPMPGARRRFWRLPFSGLQQLVQWGRLRSRAQLALALVVLLLTLAGIRQFAGDGGWVRGLFVTSALLKGDYVDPTNVVLGPAGGPDQADAGLIGMTLLYSLVGTLLSSALVALILDQLLLARLGRRRARRIPRDAQPILLVGGGQLAAGVSQLLRRERQLLVRVEDDEGLKREDEDALFAASLEQAERLLRQRPVRAVALLSGRLLTDLQNLLRLQARWPDARFALLARNEGTGERLGDLLGGASLISPIELGADVVVATAFGERVEGVWRIQGHNLLQVRYRVSAGDTLSGRSVSRLDHGYGLTVLSLSRPRQSLPTTLPAPGTLLAEGDELVVLASLAALRRVEQGQIQPPQWILSLELPQRPGRELGLTLRQLLARHLGLTPAEAGGLLQGRRQAELPVDPDCGALLLRDLQRQGVAVALQPRGNIDEQNR